MISSLELAKICGVSQGTVDRALHGRKGVSETTRQLILAAAEKHGYRPHPAAREMMGGKRTIVGAIVPALNSIFFMDLLNAVREKLTEAGLRLFLTPVSSREEFFESLEDFAARRCRAAIVIPPEDGLEILPQISRDLPVISLLSPCRGENTFFISPDETRAGYDAARYLLSLGHTRIVHLTYSRQSPAIIARRQGYENALREKGMEPFTLAPLEEEEFLRVLKRYKPTALFCHNDWLALSAMRLLGQAGKRIPEDVSVLGVDDSPTFIQLCPDITTLRYPASSVAQAVLACLQNNSAPPPVDNLVLVERSTVREL
jgi:DNA-binding LacI/PurR family transcriptional regulator